MHRNETGNEACRGSLHRKEVQYRGNQDPSDGSSVPDQGGGAWLCPRDAYPVGVQRRTLSFNFGLGGACA